MKKFTSVLLSIIMLVGMIPLAAVPAFAENIIPAALQKTVWKGTMKNDSSGENETVRLWINSDSIDVVFWTNNKSFTFDFSGLDTKYLFEDNDGNTLSFAYGDDCFDSLVITVGDISYSVYSVFTELQIPDVLQNTSWKGAASPSKEDEPTPFTVQIGKNSVRFTYNGETKNLFLCERMFNDKSQTVLTFIDRNTFEVFNLMYENNAISNMYWFGANNNNAASQGEITKCTTLRDILDEVGGTYSGQRPGATTDLGGNFTVDAKYALSSSSIENEIRVLFDGTMIYGEKVQYDAESKKAWRTELGATYYGDPTIDDTITIEDILNAPVILTESETEIKYDDMFRGKASTTVPAGSYYCETLNSYFYTTEEGVKKLDFGGVVLTRDEEEPESHTLRDIIDKVSGTYIGIDSGNSATMTISSDEISTVIIHTDDYAEKVIIGNTDTRSWYTETFENGQPVFADEPEIDGEETIETYLNLEVEILTEDETVADDFVVPAGSYVVGKLLIFYNEQNGVTQNLFLYGTALNRIGGAEHEHTFSDEWSSSATHHWHEATCEHTGFTSNFGEHTFGTDGKCTACGYEKQTDALTEAKTAMKAEIDAAVVGTSDEIKSYAQTAKEEIDECTGITELSQKFAAVLNEISEMKAEEAIAEVIADSEKELEKYKKQVNDLTDELEKMSGELNTVKGQKAELEKQLKELQGKADAKDAEIASLKEQIKVLNGQITAKEKEINSLNSQLDAAKKEIERLKEQGGDPGTGNTCPKCGGTHANDFFGKIVCFFNQIGNFFKNLFK